MIFSKHIIHNNKTQKVHTKHKAKSNMYESRFHIAHKPAFPDGYLIYYNLYMLSLASQLVHKGTEQFMLIIYYVY